MEDRHDSPSLKSLSLLWNRERYVDGGSALRAHVDLGDMWVTGTKCDYPPLPVTRVGYPLPRPVPLLICDCLHNLLVVAS